MGLRKQRVYIAFFFQSLGINLCGSVGLRSNFLFIQYVILYHWYLYTTCQMIFFNNMLKLLKNYSICGNYIKSSYFPPLYYRKLLHEKSLKIVLLLGVKSVTYSEKASISTQLQIFCFCNIFFFTFAIKIYIFHFFCNKI